jgi:hypothetical protein
VSVVALEVIDPAPFSVHNMVTFEDEAPLTLAVASDQMVALPPAEAVGGATNVSVLFEVAFAYPPFPVAVNVKVTFPVSPIPGAYVAAPTEVALAMEPLAVVIHKAPALLVALAAVPRLIDDAVWQLENADSATAVAGAKIVIL